MQAAIVFNAVPLALAGEVFTLFLQGIPFSISAAFGFVALSEVAFLSELVMMGQSTSPGQFVHQLTAERKNMTSSYRAILGAIAVLSSIAAPAFAHISVWPRESLVGAFEKYTLRVPTEGKVPTTSVELDVPEGVVLGAVEMSAGWKHEVKMQGDKITNVVWQVNIPTAQFVELSFIARNPGGASNEVVWPIRQKFADGRTEDMTKSADGKTRPTATVKLNPPVK